MQIIQREKIAAFEQLAHQNTEPDFDLIHPRCMFGGVIEHHFVHRVMQKGRAAFHRMEDAALAFDAQALRCDAFLFRHPAHQGFGLMDVQIIQHDAPLRCLGIASDQVLEMGQGIFFGARRAPGWLNDMSGDHVEIDEPGQRPMPDVFELASQDMAWLHGQVRILALQGLHPGQLIHADRALPALGPLGGTCIDLTAVANLLVTLRIGHFIQPIPEAVWLQAPFLSR